MNKRGFDDISSVKDVTDRMLSTLESRRDQLASRSAVGLAAASGLLVLAIQFIFSVVELEDFNNYLIVVLLLVICTVFCSASIITSLDLIKKISRKKHMGKKQKHTDPNIFFFGWITKNSESDLMDELSRLTTKKQVLYEVRQSISLSKNLEYRYKQLSKMYIYFSIGLVIYVFSIAYFVFIKYEIFGSMTL